MLVHNTRQSFKYDPLKPFVSGESCYELHMQENPAYLQRYQFWALMLAGAAGHTYGAAGIWHMATPEAHGNWGGWGGQPYDLTTWNEGMNFPGSAQLGHAKALLEKLPWQQFKEHLEWVGKDLFAAGVPEKIRVIYQPGRGVYNWNGIAVNGCMAESVGQNGASQQQAVESVTRGDRRRRELEARKPSPPLDRLLLESLSASGGNWWSDVGGPNHAAMHCIPRWFHES